MASTLGGSGIWDVRAALVRLEEGHYKRYRETYQRVAVMGNALSGISFRTLYMEPARAVLATTQSNIERSGMVDEHLLTSSEQQACIAALRAIDDLLQSQPDDLTLYSLCTDPSSHTPELLDAFKALDATSNYVCVPFVHPGYDPETAKLALDAFLDLFGDAYTYKDLYEKAPKLAWKESFNRVVVGTRREGLLIELRGLRKPASSSYVSDPEDERWDVRSCVAPENAALFKDVHQKINTMAYLMTGLTYGDFFNLPMKDAKVLPHFKQRIAEDDGYWFTALEAERISKAIDAIVAFLNADNSIGETTLRDVYTNPDIPAGILVHFQRMLDVKPELCLPFMQYDWDHVEASAAIDVFLSHNANRSLKNLYVDEPEPVKERYTESEYRAILERRNATKALLRKTNDLHCDAPGDCHPEYHEYCSTGPYGNCAPA